MTFNYTHKVKVFKSDVLPANNVETEIEVEASKEAEKDSNKSNHVTHQELQNDISFLILILTYYK
mgnify:CR=1 FL=1